MSPDLMFWFALTTKMAITALFVSVATIIAERLGAAVGALVATLPVSAGPVYVFLALDHDATFISASAVVSLALNAATAVFVTVYVLMAQRRSLWISVSLAFTAWLATTLALGPVHWSAPRHSFSTWLSSPSACGSSDRFVQYPRRRRYGLGTTSW